MCKGVGASFLLYVQFINFYFYSKINFSVFFSEFHKDFLQFGDSHLLLRREQAPFLDELIQLDSELGQDHPGYHEVVVPHLQGVALTVEQHLYHPVCLVVFVFDNDGRAQVVILPSVVTPGGHQHVRSRPGEGASTQACGGAGFLIVHLRPQDLRFQYMQMVSQPQAPICGYFHFQFLSG